MDILKQISLQWKKKYGKFVNHDLITCPNGLKFPCNYNHLPNKTNQLGSLIRSLDIFLVEKLNYKVGNIFSCLEIFHNFVFDVKLLQFTFLFIKKTNDLSNTILLHMSFNIITRYANLCCTSSLFKFILNIKMSMFQVPATILFYIIDNVITFN